MMTNNKVQKMTILAMMIAMDVVLSPLFRVEGIAPMSSVMNVIAAVLMGSHIRDSDGTRMWDSPDDLVWDSTASTYWCRIWGLSGWCGL